MDEQDVAVEQAVFDLEAEEVEAMEPIADEVPLHWEVTPLGEVCGLHAESVQPEENPHIRYVGLEHFDSGNPSLKRWGAASEVTSSKSRFYPGDVLYGKLRPYLDKAALVDFEGICSTDILVLTPGPTLAASFLSHLLHTRRFINHATKHTHGVNHPRTSWSALAKYEILLPPLPEQRAIARTLRTVQEAIQARRREMELERERKAALLQQLFTHGTRGEPTKQTEIGEMPEGWRVVQLGEVARIERGKFTHRPRNDPAFYGGAIPFIQTGDVTAADGHILTYSQTLNEKGLSVSKVFPRGTIVITIAANIGYTGILEFDSAFPDSLIGITPGDRVDTEYLHYYLTTQQPEMDQKAPQGTQKNINIEFLSPWPVLLPPLTEQQEIASLLQACDTKITTLEQETTLLEELFRALLEELMTGQISVAPLVAAEVAV